MEFFDRVQRIRLRSVHGKCLGRSDDDTTVILRSDDSSLRCQWIVEVSQDDERIRLRSSTNIYLFPLSAEEAPVAGRRVTLLHHPSHLELAEWLPKVKKGRIQLKDVSGRHLRANASIPPWRSSVTISEIPRIPFIRSWLLWRVEVISTRTLAPGRTRQLPQPPMVAPAASAGFARALPLSLMIAMRTSQCEVVNDPPGT